MALGLAGWVEAMKKYKAQKVIDHSLDFLHGHCVMSQLGMEKMVMVKDCCSPKTSDQELKLNRFCQATKKPSTLVVQKQRMVQR